MRELKFRCWDTRNNRWCDIDSWLPPFPTTFNLNEIFSFAEKHGICIQQYTGFKDRDGKEIYEGDILDSLYGESVGDQTAYEIRWAKCYAGERWCEFLVRAEDGAEIIGNLKPHNFYGGISFTSERTIIGNIFEGIKYEKN